MYTKFCSEKLKGRHHLEDLDVDRRTMSESVLKKYIRRVWTGFIWLEVRYHWLGLANMVMNLRFQYSVRDFLIS
jgi:hypothetical protein